MSESDEKDPLDAALPPDRVYYALGALLGVEDFGDEQTYHRGRLARALAYLDGSGTIAGTKVSWKGPRGPDEEIVVGGGLVLDRLGRLIEVPRDACLRLDRWYQAQAASDLVQGFHAASGGVIADVFVMFVACERGKTPAFATGPFDATDYVVPSRIRDGYRLDLVIRKEGAPGLPQSPWPDLAGLGDANARRAALREAIFAAWDAPPHHRDEDTLVPLAEHAAGQDTTSVFLARLVIPATAGDPPQRNDAPVTVDNDARAFVPSPGALARALALF